MELFTLVFTRDLILATIIHECRVRKNISIDHMVEQTGITKSRYYRVESGESEVGLLMCADIAKALGETVEGIFSAYLKFQEHVLESKGKVVINPDTYVAKTSELILTYKLVRSTYQTFLAYNGQAASA